MVVQLFVYKTWFNAGPVKWLPASDRWVRNRGPTEGQLHGHAFLSLCDISMYLGTLAHIIYFFV